MPTDEDDHHDDVVHYLQPLSKEELIALGRELGLTNKRLTEMNDVAGTVCIPPLRCVYRHYSVYTTITV